MAKGLLVRCCLPFIRGNGREQGASASRASHDVREKGKATSVARDEVALIRFRLPPSKSPVIGAIEAKGRAWTASLGSDPRRGGPARLGRSVGGYLTSLDVTKESRT